MMNIPFDERETIIYISAVDRSEVIVFTDDPVMQRKIEKLNNFEIIEDGGYYKNYKLDGKQVSIKNLKILTDEEKRAIAERFRKSRVQDDVQSMDE